MIEAAVLTLALVLGETTEAASAPRITVADHATPAAWHQQPTPLHQPYYQQSPSTWHAWKRALLHRQWLVRYTIQDGTHYLPPADYRRALDYPWHAPRLPHEEHGFPAFEPAFVPLHDGPPPALPNIEEVYPDPDVPLSD